MIYFSREFTALMAPTAFRNSEDGRNTFDFTDDARFMLCCALDLIVNMFESLSC
jgi:hypothetical protein